MLSAEENERICRVGPGTPMGAAIRRYWFPAMLSSDLPEPDCAPRQVRLLGEDFVAFRDSNGVVGLLDELCAHRGASLALGRVEDCGIRCLYHGWKYAVDGTILETPNTPNPQIKERIRATAYPVHEAGELIWVYLGPADLIPPLPSFRYLGMPSENRVVSATVQKCNYVQIMEGLVDSSHAPSLHHDALCADGHFNAEEAAKMTAESPSRIEVINTDFGFCSTATRSVSTKDGPREHARVTAFMAPIFSTIPPESIFAAVVPIDDERTFFVNVYMNEDKPINTEPLRTETLAYFGVTPEIVARMGLSYETWDLPTVANKANGFLQDRAAMKSGTSFTGIPDFVAEDAVVCASMGPIVDRTREHLVPADAGVIRMRRLLARCADMVEKGEHPIGYGVDLSEVGGPAADLTPGQDWTELAGISRTKAW